MLAWDSRAACDYDPDAVRDSYEDPPLVSGGKTIRITFDGKLEDFRCAREAVE